MKLTVLGAGPGGYVAAIRAAQSGLQVTVIEEDKVGGTCLNRGCIPTKAVIASLELLARIREAETFGIEIPVTVEPNLRKIIERKNKIVDTQIKGIRNLFKNRGINLVNGRGELSSPRQVRATSEDGSVQIFESDFIIIATGSRPYQIPILPFDGKIVISSDDALNLSEIPKSIIIIGAGVIGCEFACIFRRLGTEVTILEMLPRPLSTEDAEISAVLEREFKKMKIRLLTGVKAEKTVKGENSVTVYLQDGREISAEKALVSVGRAFNSEGIGTENAGINKGTCGEILVDEKMQTNIPGVYAIGDVIGGIMLAHVASHEGLTAIDNILGRNRHIDYNSVPAAIFTSPEIASVGLREFQAEEKGVRIKTGHFLFRALGRAHAAGEIDGLVKVLSDAGTDKVLGVHIIGPHASDIIHEAALAIRKGLSVKDISETVHAHPTFSEALMEASEDIHGMAIHNIRKDR